MTKTLSEHVLNGTFRSDRHNPTGLMATGNPPEEVPGMVITDRAKQLYYELTKTLTDMTALSEQDLYSIGLLATMLEQIEDLQKFIANYGYSYIVKDNLGNTTRRAYPEVNMLSTTRQQARRMLADFGLTPVSRGKVSPLLNPDENGWDG